MVFMNGKNNLEPVVLKDMNEVELAGSSDKVNIVAEAGRKPAGRGICCDDETGNNMTTPQLGPALREMGGVDRMVPTPCPPIYIARTIVSVKSGIINAVPAQSR